ncbi:MAG: AAA family ATPase [Bacteroidales bacterium]|nr:AAA family ATPase [Bacteroidales bacterium]MBR4457656.1 AAA family ATPase [Clostridia bacterium]
MKLFAITGCCGAGKSTMRDELAKRLDPDRFACMDQDEMGLNWWDYAGREDAYRYKDEGLAEAVRRAQGRHLVFVSCINPQDFIAQQTLPAEIEATEFIVLIADDEVIAQRLRDRPAERGFTSEEIIAPHIGFNRWFRKNRNKFAFVLDNTALTPEEAAEIIATHIRKRAE